MTSIRIPAFAFALASVALASGAQTNNPLGTGLPLTVHAQANCYQNAPAPGGPSDERVGAFAASCSVSPAPVAPDVARASADLSSGTLRVTAVSDTSTGVQFSGLGKASFYDTLTFSGFTGAIPITMNMSVHGSFSGVSRASEVFGTLAGFGGLTSGSGASFHLVEGSLGELFFLETPTGTLTTNMDPITHRFPRDDIHIDMSHAFPVTAGVPFWFVASLLVASGSGNVVVDFAHTAQLSLELPPGVTFTSTSGAFLTAVAAPVPEPETAWLLLAGVLPLVARLRWRQTTVCASSPCA